MVRSKEQRGEGRSERPKRRRRGRRKRKGGPPEPKNRAVEALERDSTIDADKPAEMPLSPAESAEMREHFRFLARYRKILRLKLNAQEDLLVNGARAPEHRGVCMHLLHKVDRATVKAALTRVDDPEARVRLLEGIVRFSSDIAIVILFLESLSAGSSREQAAAALTVALRGLDFEQVSPAQMRRLLDLIVELFDSAQRPALLFDLLAQKSFRETFDASLPDLPEDVAHTVAPLRAVWGAMRGKGSRGAAHDDLRRGATLLLSAPETTLRAYPHPMREALFSIGLTLPSDERPVDALDAILKSFDAKSRTASKLAMAWSERLLSEHDDRRARRWLEWLVEHHPSFRQPKHYLEALDGPWVGRVALLDGALSENTDPNRFHRALWLDGQRSAWVRVGTAEQASVWESEAAMHGRLALPGLAPVLAHGTGDGGIPYIAVAAVGKPARTVLKDRSGGGLDHRALAREAVVLLGALSLAGLVLPDAHLERFLLDRNGRLWLASLAGVARSEPPIVRRAPATHDAEVDNLGPARAVARELIRRGPHSAQTAELLTRFDEAKDIAALAELLV